MVWISVDINKVVRLEMNAKKTRYMLLSRHKNAWQNRDNKIANRFFEYAAQFRYLGTAVTKRNLIQAEIKWRLNLGNASYHSVNNILFSRLLSKNVKIRMCGTWSLTLKD
jgi:hypothetical protein